MRILKKIILLALFILSIIGCTGNSKEEVFIRTNVEENLKDTLNDPSSYEFVSLNAFDTVRYKKNIDEFRKLLEDDITFVEKEIDIHSVDITDTLKLEKYKNDLIKKKRIQKELDSLELSMGSNVNDIAAFIYIYSFRAKNSFGAIVLYKYYIEITSGPDYKILNIASDKGKLLVTPNGFPGRNELVSKIKSKTIIK